jgi:SAP domain-containing new25
MSPADRPVGMPASPETKTPLAVGISVPAFDAGSWRKEDLIAFARELGIPTSGTKDALTKRIRGQLGRVHPPTETVVTPSHVAEAESDTVITPAVLKAIEEPATRIAPREPAPASATPPTNFFRAAPGQSRSQALAAWFASRQRPAR